MQVSTLLADPEAISLWSFVSHEGLIVLRVRVIQKEPRCSLCRTTSTFETTARIERASWDIGLNAVLSSLTKFLHQT